MKMKDIDIMHFCLVLSVECLNAGKIFLMFTDYGINFLWTEDSRGFGEALSVVIGSGTYVHPFPKAS